MKHLTTFRVIDAIARTGSIRGAADHLALTPSAVQRRLQSYEEEIGFEIFDRGPQGVDLNSAGELVIMHIRETFSETRKLTSRLADLSGMRRGEVRIGCSQALVPYFLPHHISSYQTTYPNVVFEVIVLDHRIAQSALASHAIDLAVVFAADEVPEFKTLLGVRQQLVAVMGLNHPLANFEQLRLRQCYEYPLALPSVGFGSRAMVDLALQEKSYSRLPEMESNSFEYLKSHVAKTSSVTFQIECGAPLPPIKDLHLTARIIDQRDVAPGTLWIGQLAGRSLSVTTSRFAEQIGRDLSDRYQHVEF
jgi:DNA-binding transcriptional LysR family regulator|tara:strand:- start:362 stop:1279 length:918 start_codon:yes stop_codon:yes gene_type:complete